MGAGLHAVGSGAGEVLCVFAVANWDLRAGQYSRDPLVPHQTEVKHMEWYDWVFAICGAGMALMTVLAGHEIYESFRYRRPRGGAGPRTGR